MQARKSTPRLPAAAALVLASALVAFGQSTPAPTSPGGTVATNLPAFQVTTVREDLPGAGVHARSFLTVGTNQFAFLAPTGFRSRTDEPNRTLVLTDRDDACSITIRLHPKPQEDALDPRTKELRPEPFRQMLLARHANATILDAYSLTAAGRSGPAFDLTWKHANGFSFHSRVAFIPTGAGVMEFHLLTTPPKLKELQYHLNSLLITFRANVGGKLEVAPLSNKF